MILFAGTMLIVGVGHRRVFRASGWGVGGFLRSAWREFARDLDAMQPLHATVDPHPAITRLDPSPTLGGPA